MRSAPKAKPDNNVPQVLDISLEDFQRTFPTWTQWRATDRKFLPTELRKQPQDLLDNIIYIDMLMEKIIGQYVERMKEKERNK